MAMFDNIFAGDSGVASMLLNTMGISAQYIKKSSVYNPRTDTTEDTSVVKTVKISPLLKYSTYEIATLGLTKEDSKIIGKGSDFADITNSIDQLKIHGSVYTIMNHNEIWSGDKLAAVNMQVRLQKKKV